MKFIMTDPAKIKRAKDKLGEEASVLEIFNEYNRIGGLIKDENYNNVANWIEDAENSRNVKESEVFEYEVAPVKKVKKVIVKKTVAKVKKTVAKVAKAVKESK